MLLLRDGRIRVGTFVGNVVGLPLPGRWWFYLADYGKWSRLDLLSYERRLELRA